MFARTFSIRAHRAEISNPCVVLNLIEDSVLKDMVGREPATFCLFADSDVERDKVIFYDVSNMESVIEFSSIYGRLPGFCVECDGSKIKTYHFHPDNSEARVYDLAVKQNGGRREVISVAPDAEEGKKESSELKVIVSSTDGLLQSAEEITGKVVCRVVENAETKEKRPCFTLKLDVKHDKYRGILRSCKLMHFAWSEDVSYMVLVCRFKMLPAFAITLPVMGMYVRESMELYIKTNQAVGMVMYSDDVSDAFTIEKSEPTFEQT